ncbi:MAG: DUF4263 domain-containing protein [Psychrobacter sp.]|nr:DUF4263 domain-containing protein [Psychrobacter sp.]
MSSAEKIWAAIYDFYCLLISETNDEASYQKLFEQHPVIFTVLRIDTAESFEKSSPNTLPFDQDREFHPEPDFVGANIESGVVTVVELKTPFVGNITTSRNDGNRAKFKAIAETYISQTTEYVESIRQNLEARDVIKKVLSVSKTSDYRAKLIYALSSDNDAHLVNSLMANRKIPTEIVFYDDLFDLMVKAYSIGRSDSVPRAGWCFVTHIYLGDIQSSEKTFIADCGSASADRISVCLHNNEIIFECFDSQKNLHLLKTPLEGKGPHYIRFEFTNDSDGMYMSLNVNNIESEFRLGKGVLKLFPETEFFTIGADLSGNNGAYFYMLEQSFFNRTMGLVDKLNSFRNFQQKVSKTSHCLEFKPKDYMVRQPLGMVQELDAFKPILRDWPLVKTKV